MDFVDILISFIFVPLWPLGVVLPAITTAILLHRRRNLIVVVPVVSTAIWLIARVVLLWDVISAIIFPASHSSNTIDIPFESLVIIGTIGLTLVVLVLSALSAWTTHKILKISEHKQ